MIGVADARDALGHAHPQPLRRRVRRPVAARRGPRADRRARRRPAGRRARATTRSSGRRCSRCARARARGGARPRARPAQPPRRRPDAHRGATPGRGALLVRRARADPRPPRRSRSARSSPGAPRWRACRASSSGSLGVAGLEREAHAPAWDRPFVMPSPNMPTYETALVYPGGCLVEGTNLSEGRGTTRPFEIVGAPWIDGARLARRAATRWRCPACARARSRSCPTFQKHAGSVCGGVQIHVTDAAAFRPVRHLPRARGAGARARTPRSLRVPDRALRVPRRRSRVRSARRATPKRESASSGATRRATSPTPSPPSTTPTGPSCSRRWRRPAHGLSSRAGARRAPAHRVEASGYAPAHRDRRVSSRSSGRAGRTREWSPGARARARCAFGKPTPRSRRIAARARWPQKKD